MSDNYDGSAQDNIDDPLDSGVARNQPRTLEQSLTEETVAAIQSCPFTSISPDISVEQAIHLLADRGVACALVEEDGALVGVFTDRDVLNKVALEYQAMKHRPVRDVMTVDPVYIRESDSSAAALCVMAVMGHRHVPVVDRDLKILGIVTPHRITSFLLSHVDA